MKKIYPFKFLNSYAKKDKDFFFGRNEEVDRLYKMIFKTNILVVYGTSGTGKTSLIQCGLANKFSSYDWLDLYIRRGSNIITSLEMELDKYLPKRKQEALNENYNQKSELLNIKEKVEAVYKSSFKPIYLIFDQFEELFLIKPDKKEQQDFISKIREILAMNRQVKIILIIREEYLGYLYDFEKEIPGLLNKTLRVEPMGKEKVGEVLRGINECDNSLVSIEPNKIDKITEKIFSALQEKNALTIQLPYLQVYLDKLYKDNLKEDKKKIDNYDTEVEIKYNKIEKNKKLEDVLQSFLVTEVAKIKAELETKHQNISIDIIWSILSKFVTLEGTKVPTSIKNLSSSETKIDQGVLNDAVKIFANKRILRLVDENDTYELSHDSLALKIIERTSADDIKLLEARSFIRGRARTKGEFRKLLDQNDLNRIKSFGDKLVLGKLELDFIKESEEEIKSDLKRIEKARKKEEKKKRHRMYWIFGFILVVIFFLGLLLQAAYVKNEIMYDKLVVEDMINSTDLKIKSATNEMRTDPTNALIMDKNTMSVFDKIENEEPYKRLKNGSYGWYNKILFPFIKGFYNVDIIQTYKDVETTKLQKRDELKKHGENLLKENQALYKEIDFKKNRSKDKFTISGDKAINLIFHDTLDPEKFEIWSTDKVLMDTIIKYEKNLEQIVFPFYESEAIGRDKNGNAGFFRKNRAYNGLKMDSLYMELNISGPLQVNNIAPIRYEKIGYKLLTAIDKEKIVEWNLNGTIRHNDEEPGKRTSPVIYKKQDIQLGDKVVSIAISRRRHKIFTATNQGIGVMWFADTSRVKLGNNKKIAWGLHHEEDVLCSSFSNDGKLILTGSKDHTVALYNADTGELIKKLKGHTAPVTSVAFSLGNKYVFTGSANSNYKKWKMPNGLNDSTINYKSLKWHNLDSFESIYDIKIKDSIDYAPPTIKLITGNQN